MAAVTVLYVPCAVVGTVAAVEAVVGRGPPLPPRGDPNAAVAQATLSWARLRLLLLLPLPRWGDHYIAYYTIGYQYVLYLLTT